MGTQTLIAFRTFFLLDLYDMSCSIVGFGAHPSLSLRYANEATPAHETFNMRHASCRVPVEWAFGHVSILWAFVDFHKNQKFFLQPVGVYYRVAVLLTNMHACIYGSEIASHFEVDTPSLHEYLHVH